MIPITIKVNPNPKWKLMLYAPMPITELHPVIGRVRYNLIIPF
jgi:hypothetical protein